jgi:alanine dehydrogenase
MSGTSMVYSNEANLAELLPRVDLVIGAVLVPGAKAPKLITREMLRLMPKGSVFVDIAVKDPRQIVERFLAKWISGTRMRE